MTDFIPPLPMTYLRQKQASYEYFLLSDIMMTTLHKNATWCKGVRFIYFQGRNKVQRELKKQSNQ